MTIVRAGGVEDLPEVAALWVRLTRDERALGVPIVASDEAAEAWLASFRRHLGKLAFLWIAEEGSETIAGFLLARLRAHPPYLGAELVGEIASIYVDPSQRGRGVGEELVRVAIESLRSAGVAAVETNAHVANRGACRFWEANGFAAAFTQYRLPLE